MVEEYKVFSSWSRKRIENSFINDVEEAVIKKDQFGRESDTVYLSPGDMKIDMSVRHLIEANGGNIVIGSSGEQYEIVRNDDGTINRFEKQDLSRLREACESAEAMRKFKELQEKHW